MKIQLSLLFIFFTIALFAQEKKILKDKQMSGTTIDEKQLGFLMSHQEALKEFERPTSMGMLEIPVKVHILRSSQDKSPISIDEVKNAFALLNRYFIQIYVQFVPLGDFNYIRNDKLFNLNKEDENTLCNAHDIENVINLYITGSIEDGPMQFCGYTHYPQGPEKNIDRILIAKDCLNNGVALARQMGHYFTLFATSGLQNSETQEWVNGSNCSTEGDLICDTPADPGLTHSTVDDRCGYIGRKQDQSGRKRFYKPDTKNLMSDNPRLYCCDHFTEQQYQKMLYAALHLRKYLTFPKSQYSKRQLKILAEEKGLQGEVSIYIYGEEMTTKRDKNMYINQGGTYGANTPYNIAIANHKKGYIYVLEGDAERGIHLQYPQKGDKVFFKGEEMTEFLVPSNNERLKVDESKGEDGKNHIVVLFSKKQLRIEQLINEMNSIEEQIDVVQKIYMTIGIDLIPSNNLTYGKSGIKVQGVATDQQIMPIIIEYLQH
ncbi:zinc metalloprotease [Aureispira anguillae]|uniref:DUF4384 domain-containing protein n=1 Tax=Aureispira anguillae TaxID=2864201 RepID=A0A915YBZ8_9BACT|nr:DUF4384 domain-containing protein [Aureispira anguillae]BDS10289.1 DUF4384 domain-containing protein [Aureispira anguillae]